MEPGLDRLIIIGGVFLTIITGRINKLVGGICGLLLTTGIMIWGLFVYSRPGYTMTFFGAEISQEIFMVLVVVWYIFDVKQIMAVLKEKRFIGATNT
jgi:hypothetical protein